MTIIATRNDVGQVWTDTCQAGTPAAAVDLTGATVKWIIRHASTTVEKTATIVSAAAGTVSYTTVAGDYAGPAGWWQQEWQATWPSGRIATFYGSSSAPTRFVLREDLNPA